MRSVLVMTNIGPVMQAITQRYGYFEPYTPHQKCVLAHFFAEALTRVYGLIVCPEQSEMSGYPLTNDELRLISDTSMDSLMTQTMSFPTMRPVIRDCYYGCRVSSSVALILTGI